VSTEGPSGVATAAAAAPTVAHGPAHRAEHHVHTHLIFPNLLDTFRSLLSIIVIALFVLTFVVQPFRIPSESMERTLLVGDFLLVNKSVYGPGPGTGYCPTSM
jgi:signal peptidase I